MKSGALNAKTLSDIPKIHVTKKSIASRVQGQLEPEPQKRMTMTVNESFRTIPSIYECPKCGWRGGRWILQGYGDDVDGYYCNKCMAYEITKNVPKMIRLDEADLSETRGAKFTDE
jgi:hypothetical protein